MRPDRPLLYALLGWIALATLVTAVEGSPWVWAAGGTLVLVAAAGDAVWGYSVSPPSFTRPLPGRLAVGVWASIPVRVTNRESRPLHLTLFDGVPSRAEHRHLPLLLDLPPGATVETGYTVRPLERGTARFRDASLLVRSPLRLWRIRHRVRSAATVPVYPNYEPVLRYVLLSLGHREEQMGIIRANRPGVSKEFQQLREYRRGDVLQQVDWKATARHQKLVSREYMEQRDQELCFLIDCSPRLRAMDGPLPQFDHCLNATLLLAYIALRQGDRLSVMGSAHSGQYLPPVKNAGSMPRVLNHLYGYQTTSEACDYDELAERLMMLQRRRALVILLTNLRSEDTRQLLPSLRTLQRRHLVLLASLRERTVDETLAAPVGNLDQALTHLAGAGYLAERGRALEALRRQGVHTIDETADRLPVDLANRYFQIKQRGLL